MDYKQIIKMNDWNDKEEEFLKKLSFQSALYYNYYNKESQSYYSLLKRFSIPILVVSSINSLMAVTLSTYMPQHIVSILNAILSATTGILGSIQLFLKINEKMSACLLTASAFNHLSLKITKELSINREIRVPDGRMFLNECFNEFNAIIDKAPPLDRRVNNLLILDEFNKLSLKKSKSTFSLNKEDEDSSLTITPKSDEGEGRFFSV